jgi:hypothetical protein
VNTAGSIIWPVKAPLAISGLPRGSVNGPVGESETATPMFVSAEQ